MAGNFYPRSPCGERLRYVTFSSCFHVISIHALLAESDLGFQLAHADVVTISIHALLAESDSLNRQCSITQGISIHALLAESDRLTKTR